MTRKIPMHAMQQPLPSDATVIASNVVHSEIKDVDTSARKMIYTIHTSLLFDPHQKEWLTDVSVQVDKQTGLITSVYERATKDADIEDGDLDLRQYTVLPGFVDAHAHVFLHDYKEASSINQERDESFVERIVRATNHCRLALLAGYTTYRDLGTEGLFSADVSLRNTINRGLTPGPRLLVATEALASSSGYAIRLESHFPTSTTSIHAQVPRLADSCDGVDACRAAVRRRLGAGADIIKFYADYRRRQLRFPPPAYPGGRDVRFPPEDRNPASTLFTQDEMDAIVSEARRARCPVAAHCATPEGVVMAAQAGVTSVEHGFVRSDQAIEAMVKHGIIFVPTLAVVEADGGGRGNARLVEAMAQTAAAFRAGVRFAAGGDTGAFAHGENVREVELMVEAGVPFDEVLVAVTLGGWKACGGEWCGRRFGGAREGWSADFVAVEGDVRRDLGALRRVRWVVKDGEVVVREGRLVGVGVVG